MDQGLVEERDNKDSEDSRRRYYRLTSSGRQILAAEVARLEGVIRQARQYLKPLSPKRTP
jgi:DNA-binding PadR family transcriptional regulator